MPEIKIVLNGREIPINKLGIALEAEVLRAALSHVEETIRNLRCPEHNQPPQIIASGKSLDKMQFEVSGCCEKFIQQVEEAL